MKDLIKENFTVLYLTLESYDSQPIIKSQVVTLLHNIGNRHNIRGRNINFSLFTKEPKHLSIDDDNCINFNYIKDKGFLFSIFYLFFKAYPMAKRSDLIHVRSYLPMISALLFKLFLRKRIIFDMRGVFPEEIALRTGKKMWHFVFKFLEKRFCRWSDAIVVVSKSFENHICSIYPKVKSKIFVIPTFSNELLSSDNCNLINIKRDYFQNENVKIFVYSGAYEKWQCTKEVFDLFLKLTELNVDYRFAIFSHHYLKFMEYAKNRGCDLSKFYFAFCENKVLTNYLSQCDVGILFREKTLINCVAAPIKFTDYLTSKLVIVASNYIGDTSNIVSEFELGFLIENLDLNSIVTLAKEINLDLESKLSVIEDNSKKALLSLNIDSAANKYVGLYLSLNNINLC